MWEKRDTCLLPVTGQTTEYQSGDDGTYQAGAVGARMIDNGDGTVSDKHTGLTWVKTPHLMIPGTPGVASENTIQVARGVWSNANDYVAGDVVQGDGAPDSLFYACILANGPGGVEAQEPPNATYWVQTVWIGSAANLTTAGTYNWSNSITYCNGLGFAGFDDWRAPNIFEMVSLWDGGAVSSPSISDPFEITAGDTTMWSSTTRIQSSSRAHLIIYGTSLTVSFGTKSTGLAPTIPVRGGRFNA